MSQSGLAPFDSTLQTTNVWLNDIQERLGWGWDHHRAYRALELNGREVVDIWGITGPIRL